MLLTKIMPWLVNCRLRFCRRRRRNIAILLSLVSLLCAIAWGHFQLNRLDQLTISGDARYFTVKKGMSARSLVSELAGQPVSSLDSGLVETASRAGTDQDGNLPLGIRLAGWSMPCCYSPAVKKCCFR